MANVQIGLSSLVEQPIERGWDRRSGYYTNRRWHGTQALCEAKRAELIATTGYSNAVLRELYGGVWEVLGRIDSDVDGNNNPSPETSVVDTWELSANRVEKDVLSSDITSIQSLSQENLNILRDFADGKLSFSDYPSTSPNFSGGSASAAAAIWNLMKSGVKSVAVYAPVLRKNVTVPDGYSISAALGGVGSIWTTGAILAAEAIPSSVSNNLPSSSIVTTDAGTFRYAWLKSYPTISASVDGKIQASQEWEWGLWSTALYSVVT